jgi:hypothetical protein
MTLTPLIQLPAAWISVDQLFGLHLYEGHVSLADMDKLQIAGDRWTREHPAKRVELVVIYPSNARMTGEERKRMGGLIKRGNDHRVASATVILAGGLVGSAQRSVLTALRFLAPPPHPLQVFSAVNEAVAWLLPYAREVNGRQLSEAALLSAIDTHRGEFERRSRE